MLKFYILAAIALLASCDKKEANGEAMEKAEGSYGALIEKAKGTEAALQKKADSIASRFDSLGIPK